MEKIEILSLYKKPTNLTYKFNPLFVGDVYKNEFGTYGIVLSRPLKNGTTEYYYKKENKCEHVLPAERNGMNDSTFVGNVAKDKDLMDKFIKLGIIETDKEEKMTEEVKETKETKETKKETKAKATKTTLNLWQKINAIREEWAKTELAKEGKGRAGGGAKYDYYKPQQIIDFCLAQEQKHNLYSRFNTSDPICYYEVMNLDNLEEKEMVCCPFDVPRKMAASEAQQVGAAMTYYNRRLAMMLYKIEDNSKESLDVMENADYTTVEIPAPPVMQKAEEQTIVPPIPPTEAVVPPVQNENVQLEPPSTPVNVPNIPNVPTPPTEQKPVEYGSVPSETEDLSSFVEQETGVPKMGSIESLY